MCAAAQLFVGRLNKDSKQRDIEDIFSRYGRLARCDVKYGTGTAYAFVDFEDKRDAEDAVRRENNREVDGQRIVVEWAHGPKRGFTTGRSSSTFSGDDQCYKCGKPGHFARACRSPDNSYGRPRFDGGGGGGWRGGRGGWRGGGGGGGGGYSRRRYSRSRSRERTRRRSRERSDSREKKRSPDRRSRSRSPDREQRDRSRSKERSRSRSRGRDDGAESRPRQNSNSYQDD